jgi:hypothetical protein
MRSDELNTPTAHLNGMLEQSPPQRVSFRENISQQTKKQKTVFTQIFIWNLGL